MKPHRIFHRAFYAGFLLLLASTANSLQASLVATEDFESTLGALNGQGGGAGWSGNWTASSTGVTSSVVAANLSYHQGQVFTPGGDQALQVTMDISSIQVYAYREIPIQTDTLYMSFLYRKTADSVGVTQDFLQFGFANTGGGNPTGSVMERNGTFEVRAGTGGGITTGTGIAVDTTYFVVLKMENTGAGSAYDRMSAFINPTSLVEGPASATVTSTDALDLSTSAFMNFRRAFHEVGDTYLIDTIRIGTSFSDVVTPVPEPTTVLGLLGILSASLWRRRRRSMP